MGRIVTRRPANKPGPKRKPVPFAWLFVGNVEIVLTRDGDEIKIDAPPCVKVSARPNTAALIRKAEIDAKIQTVECSEIVFVTPCRQRLVIETNQLDLCRGDIERAIAEYVGRRQKRTRLEKDSDAAENA
jgi:hypothetical protein